jgi:hypothetical protein
MILKNFLTEMAKLNLLGSVAEKEIFSDCMNFLNRLNEDMDGSFGKSVQWYLSEILHTIAKYDMTEVMEEFTVAIHELKTELHGLYDSVEYEVDAE